LRARLANAARTATALFVLIGGEPHTQWLPGTVQRRYGYVLGGRYRHLAFFTVFGRNYGLALNL
jgi:hypothetical protein